MPGLENSARRLPFPLSRTARAAVPPSADNAEKTHNQLERWTPEIFWTPNNQPDHGVHPAKLDSGDLLQTLAMSVAPEGERAPTTRPAKRDTHARAFGGPRA